jgi:hypothetical protein
VVGIVNGIAHSMAPGRPGSGAVASGAAGGVRCTDPSGVAGLVASIDFVAGESVSARLYPINLLARETAIEAGVSVMARSRSHAANGLLHCAMAPNWRDARTISLARTTRRCS